MSHKTTPANESTTAQESRSSPAGRAAQAAARVAERYAHAPTYSELLAHEARAAVCAAEAASKAALDAHDAIQCVLEGLEGASSSEPAWEPKAPPKRVPERRSKPAVTPAPQDSLVLFDESPLFSPRTEPELPAAPPDAVPARAEGRRESASPAPAAESDDDPHAREAAQPIYANLIQFPREMVATRKIRPRRAEGPLAAVAPEAQLSIFEVDPRTISTQPAAAVDEPAAPVWMRTKLSSIELEPQPGGRSRRGALTPKSGSRAPGARALEPPPSGPRG